MRKTWIAIALALVASLLVGTQPTSATEPDTITVPPRDVGCDIRIDGTMTGNDFELDFSECPQTIQDGQYSLNGMAPPADGDVFSYEAFHCGFGMLTLKAPVGEAAIQMRGLHDLCGIGGNYSGGTRIIRLSNADGKVPREDNKVIFRTNLACSDVEVPTSVDDQRVFTLSVVADDNPDGPDQIIDSRTYALVADENCEPLPILMDTFPVFIAETRWQGCEPVIVNYSVDYEQASETLRFTVFNPKQCGAMTLGRFYRNLNDFANTSDVSVVEQTGNPGWFDVTVAINDCESPVFLIDRVGDTAHDPDMMFDFALSDFFGPCSLAAEGASSRLEFIGIAHVRLLYERTLQTGSTIPLAEPCVIMDSSTAAAGDHDGPYDGGELRTVQVTGMLPSDQGGATSCVPAGATGVTVTISVNGVVQSGNLRLSAAGTAAEGGVVNFASNGLDNSNTVTVPLSANGALDVFSNGGTFGVGDPLASVRLVALAYESPMGGLGFTPITPCAVADSRPNQNLGGFFVGPFTATSTLPDIDVVGGFASGQGGGNTDCGIPESAEAVVVNVVAINPTGGPGTVAIGPTGTTPDEGPTRFAALGMNNATTTVVPLNGGETIAVDVLGQASSSTHVRLVALGYLQLGGGSTFVPVTPCAAFDTRDGAGAFAGLRTGGEITTFDVVGSIDPDQGATTSCGVPEGVSSVLLNLVAINPVAAGNLRVSEAGTVATGGVLNFTNLSPNMNNSNAVPVPVSTAGFIDVFTNGGGFGVGDDITHVRGVVLGYYVDAEIATT